MSLGDSPSPFQTYTVSHSVKTGSLRDNILNTISQSRMAVAEFTLKPAALSRESFNIRNYYTMQPEEVHPMLSQLEDVILSTDFSNMTGIEIYEYIESKFINIFGENFMMARHLLGNIYNTGEYYSGMNPDRKSTEQYMSIGVTFEGLVHMQVGYTNNGWDAGEMRSINRERLYGNMNDAEIMDALKTKYPEPMTNRSLALLAAEIQSIGLSDDIGMFRYTSALLIKSGECVTKDTMPSWEELEARWSNLLDRPANMQLLFAAHNEVMMDKDNRKNPYVLQVRDILMKLGATLGHNGLFMHDLDNEWLDALRR